MPPPYVVVYGPPNDWEGSVKVVKWGCLLFILLFIPFVLYHQLISTEKERGKEPPPPPKPKYVMDPAPPPGLPPLRPASSDRWGDRPQR
jgi:hypothetical protein